MKSTCIHHPAHERLLIIRQWQLEFCEGNHCAAALLSLFEYWHNVRLDMRDKARQANQIAQRHGEPGGQDESLLQFHSDDQLRTGLLRLYGTKKVRAARRLLAAKGVITECTNPNHRYKFDKTVYFYFHPWVVNAWIASQGGSQPLPELPHPPTGVDRGLADGCTALFVATVPACGKNADGSGKSAERSGKNADVHTEISTEMTTEITTTTTTPNPSSSNERAVEPETVCRSSSGQDEPPKDQDGNPETAVQEPTEEQPVSQEETQTASTLENRNDTPLETPKTVSQEEGQTAPAIEASSDTSTETPKTVTQNEVRNDPQPEPAALTQLSPKELLHDEPVSSVSGSEEAERVETSSGEAERVETSSGEAERVEASSEEAERIEASSEEAERIEASSEEAERIEAEEEPLVDTALDRRETANTAPEAAPTATLAEFAHHNARNAAQNGLEGALYWEPHLPPSLTLTVPPAVLPANLEGIVRVTENTPETASPEKVSAAANPADAEDAVDSKDAALEPAPPPALVYPVKLTERERDDMAQQLATLPAEIAQQMLDVVAVKLHSSQIRTNAAAVLRGMVRKYRADPDSFDPSPGFHVAENRRQRAEAEARLRAAEAAQQRQAEASVTPPLRQRPAESEGYRYFREMTRKILRGR